MSDDLPIEVIREYEQEIERLKEQLAKAETAEQRKAIEAGIREIQEMLASD